MSAPEPPKKAGRAFDWKLLRRIFSYTRPYRGWFVVALLLTLVMAALTPTVPYLIQRILDGPVVEQDVTGIRTMVLIVIGVLLSQTVISYFHGYLMGWLGQSVVRDIRTKVFNHITRLRLRVFDRSPVGMLQTRTISDVEAMNDVFSEGLVTILGEILQLTLILTLMFFISWRLTLVMLSIIPILLLATYIFNQKVKVAFQNVRKFVSQMNSFLQEHITGVLVTQLFSREKKEEEKFGNINKDHRDAHMDSVLYYSIFFPVVEIIYSLALALLVWYGTGSVMKGQLTFGIVVAFLLYMQMFFRPIRMLAEQFNTLQMGVVSAERIFAILDKEEDLEEAGAIKTLPVDDRGVRIEFRNVWFAYEKEDWVLQDVSFTVEPGEKIAFVGTTGSGKSTVISLLSGFYPVNKGSILLNGTDIREIDPSALRRLFGLVLQDVFLFSGTIAENITLSRTDISPEQVQAAAVAVGADPFIRALPGQYEYKVQERGATLSAGQRQLISFARVVAYDPQVLILDEATSNIDSESEELIQRALDRLLAGRSGIIIAHRLSTIQKADKIMVMSRGRIIESGSHAQLLELAGTYAKLYQLQFAE